MASNRKDLSQPATPEASAAQAPASSEAKSATPSEETPSVNRRSMFGVGAMGLAAMIAAACGGNTFSSGSSNGKKKTGDKPKADASDGDDDDDSGSGNPGKGTGGTPGKGSGSTGGGGPRIDPKTGELFIPAGGKETIPGTPKEGLKECKPKDENVVKCDPKTGELTALKPGDTTVTVTLPDGTTKEIPVKVYDPKNPPTNLPPETGSSDGDQADGPMDDTDIAESCKANGTSKLDTSGMEDLGGDAPKVVIYGTKRSALVAMQFGSNKMGTQVIICRDDGQLLALHGITGADGSNRPIVCDNLWIGDAAKLHIVLQDGDDRRKSEVEVKFFKEYNGKAVTDLTVGTFPDKSAIARFTEAGGNAGFDVDNNTLYPDASGTAGTNDDRPLITVKSGASWTESGGVPSGGQVTDIMGNSISITGKGLLEYQVYCVYVIQGDQAYRTIIHVG